MLNAKKMILGFCFILLFTTVLAACGGNANNESGSNTAPANDAPAKDAPAEGPTYSFRLAETHPADYPTTRADMEFAELVNEYSGGRITIDVFPSAQLGEEKAVIEQVQLGAIEFTRVSTGPLGEFNAQYGVFSLPYIFDNDDHMWSFLNGQGGEDLLNSLSSSKMQGLAYYGGGSRSFYSKEPLTSIDDLKGMQIRVIQNKVNIDIMEALGASATPMAYGEVYSSLQTGVIDGAENNYPSYFTSKHYEVAPHYLLDAHQRVPEALLISSITWDKLSAEDQDIIKRAAMDSVQFQRDAWAAFEKEAEAEVRAAGVTITEVTDPTPWQNAVKPVIDKYYDDFKEVLDAIDAAR